MHPVTIYFAPMEGITDSIFRRVHREMFGGADVYGLPFHKLTQSMTLTTREKRDVDPEENRGIDVLPQALTRDPEQIVAQVLKYEYDSGDIVLFHDIYDETVEALEKILPELINRGCQLLTVSDMLRFYNIEPTSIDYFYSPKYYE